MIYTGRAGMVAIGGDSDLEIDFEQFYAGVKEKLPSYARPYFIRIVSETDMTGISHFVNNTLEIYFPDE